MLYRQKFDTFIRQYDDVGYICSKADYGDRVVDAVGSVFLNALSRKGQTIQELVDKIAKCFLGVDIETLLQDAKEFYAMLEEDGFIISGETEEELTKKDTRFSYSALEPKTIKEDFTPIIQRSENSSQEYLNSLFSSKPYLTQLQIELTSKCNERCIHCYIPHENKISDITPDFYYSVLDQCKDMGLLNLTLSGGEPMVHKNFIDFLRKAQEYDFAVNVLSNLTLLTDEIVQEMKKNRLSSVQVSVYSMNPAIHDEITQMPGSFEKTKNAILKLVENDIPVQISCPTMKQNKNCYVDVINWAKSIKVRATTDFIMMARYDHTIDNLDNRLSLDEVKTVINEIIANDTDYQEGLKVENFQDKEIKDRSNEVVCGVGINTACMVSNGNVYPCAGWQDYVIGNLHEKSLKDIWENSEKINVLRKLRKKDFPRCLGCEDKAYCAMCMVRNANEREDGDYLQINEHFCKVAKLNKQVVHDWREKVLKTKAQ